MLMPRHYTAVKRGPLYWSIIIKGITQCAHSNIGAKKNLHCCCSHLDCRGPCICPSMSRAIAVTAMSPRRISPATSPAGRHLGCCCSPLVPRPILAPMYDARTCIVVELLDDDEGGSCHSRTCISYSCTLSMYLWHCIATRRRKWVIIHPSGEIHERAQAQLEPRSWNPILRTFVARTSEPEGLILLSVSLAGEILRCEPVTATVVARADGVYTRARD